MEQVGVESGDKDPYGILISNVLRHDGPDGSVNYFLENMEYYEKRANVYGYSDDTIRWVLLSKATLEFSFIGFTLGALSLLGGAKFGTMLLVLLLYLS